MGLTMEVGEAAVRVGDAGTPLEGELRPKSRRASANMHPEY